MRMRMGGAAGQRQFDRGRLHAGQDWRNGVGSTRVLYTEMWIGACFPHMQALKPVRWRTFLPDLLYIEASLAVFGFSLGLIIRARLGTTAWTVLEVALARIFGTSTGTMTMSVGVLVLALALVMKESVGWGTIVNILSIGPWIDITLALIPEGLESIPLRIAMFLAGILIMGLATGAYIGLDVGAGPRDTLMLGLHRKTGFEPGKARIIMDSVVVGIGTLLGGPVGLGTLAFALLNGAAIQLGFHVFRTKRRIAERRGEIWREA